jgi:son of sevenless-like protein
LHFISITFVEGEIHKISSGKRSSDRYAYLFDGCMFLCKPNVRRTSVVTGGPQHDYRLKESFYLTRVEVRDKEDTDGMNEEIFFIMYIYYINYAITITEWKNLFEIVPRDQAPIILSTRTYDEKRNWMAILVMLTTKRFENHPYDICTL